MITTSELLEAARSLGSDKDGKDGENPEYDRGLVELVATLIGLSDLYSDDPDLVHELILR